jgi:hypothetical protein
MAKCGVITLAHPQIISEREVRTPSGRHCLVDREDSAGVIPRRPREDCCKVNVIIYQGDVTFPKHTSIIPRVL